MPLTLLAVDPTQTVLSFFRQAIEDRGGQFLGARRVEDVFKRLRVMMPDVAFARVPLALDVIKALHSDPSTRSIPIVALGERGEEESLSRAVKAGAMGAIFFPLDSARILAIAQRILADRKPGSIQRELPPPSSPKAEAFGRIG